MSFDGEGVPTFYGYDSNGNPSATQDAVLRITQTLYNGRNELLATIDPELGVTSETYNAYGEVTSTTNARGFTASTAYDQRGWVASTTDDTGAQTTYLDDVAGNVTQQTDARGDVSQFGYDQDNRRTSATDALGDLSTTQYDPAGDVLSTTDARGQTSQYAYDVRGRQVASADPLGRTNYTFYNVLGEAVATVDGNGFANLTWYDLNGRPFAQRDGRGSYTFSFYDQAGNVAETIDGQAQASFTLYDADNRPVATLDPHGFWTLTAYDLAGNVSATVDERGRVTSYGYDLLDRQDAVLDPDGNLTQTVFDPAGNAVVSIDAKGNISYAGFDGDNRPVWSLDANGYLTQTGYDAVGNAVQSVDENGQTTSTWYDADNRPVVTLDPNGHFSGSVYDANSNTAASIDGNGNVTQMAYDAANQQVATLNPDGAITQTAYDGDGQVSAVTDANGNVTPDYHDGDGNTVVTSDALGHTTVSVYDKDNRLVSTTDRDGRKKVFAYDTDGRLLTETWYNANGSLADTRQYTYDNAGNMLTASNGFGSYGFTYDSAGRVLTQTDPFNLTLTLGYDNNDNVTSVQDSLGGQVLSTYDPDGRLVSRQLAGTGQTPLRLDLTYNPRGQVATVTRYKDLAGTQKVGYSSYAYDNAGNLTHVQHQNGTGGVLADYLYGYDGADQLASETDNSTTTNYAYDNAGQLTGAGSKGYSYDLNGNRTMTGYSTGGNNELTSDGTWNYSYDNEGNIVQKTNISTRETWTYGYDLDNHLTSAVHKDGSGTLITQVTMKYDVFGNRVEEDTYTQATGQTVVQRFAYDGAGNAWADLDGSNVLQTRRLYADINGQTLPFVRVSAGGVAAWYLTDHLGSVRDIVDNTGAVLDHVDYDAWGNITNETHAAAGDRFKYTAGEWQATLGLYGFGARWYAPDSGRWYSQDPLGLGPDSNPYRYVGNGPTDATDPSGMDTGLTHAKKLEAWRRTQAVLAEFQKALDDPNYPAYAEQSAVCQSYASLLQGLANHELSRQDAEDWILKDMESQVAHEIGQAYQAEGKKDPGAEAARQKASADQFYAKFVSSYRKQMQDQFWQGVDAYSFFTQTILTTALPIEAGFIYGGVYAAAGDEKRAGQALAAGVASYGVGKALGWAGRGVDKLLGSSGTATEAEAAAAAGAAPKVGAGRFINCFIADTAVSTEDGLKPIQNVRASDLIWAYDLVVGQWKLRPVIETYEHDYVGDLVAITVAGEVIKATSGHPFWVVEGQRLEDRPRPEHVPEAPASACVPGRWVDAGDLRVGDILLLKPGQRSPITQLTVYKVCQKVYNFHVEELRCYAVGTSQVLVHNNSAINNLLNPGGNPIGVAGSSATIREVAGSTLADAQNLFNQLSQGGTAVTGSTYRGTLVRLPGGGTVGLRTVTTRSPGTIATIDVNVPGVPGVTKIKFNP